MEIKFCSLVCFIHSVSSMLCHLIYSPVMVVSCLNGAYIISMFFSFQYSMESFSTPFIVTLSHLSCSTNSPSSLIVVHSQLIPATISVSNLHTSSGMHPVNTTAINTTMKFSIFNFQFVFTQTPLLPLPSAYTALFDAVCRHWSRMRSAAISQNPLQSHPASSEWLSC